jgi:hypothetical protein
MVSAEMSTSQRDKSSLWGETITGIFLKEEVFLYLREQIEGKG